MGSKGGVSVKGESLPSQLLSFGSLVVLLQTKGISGHSGYHRVCMANRNTTQMIVFHYRVIMKG